MATVKEGHEYLARRMQRCSARTCPIAKSFSGSGKTRHVKRTRDQGRGEGGGIGKFVVCTIAPSRAVSESFLEVQVGQFRQLVREQLKKRRCPKRVTEFPRGPN